MGPGLTLYAVVSEVLPAVLRLHRGHFHSPKDLIFHGSGFKMNSKTALLEVL